MTGGGEERKKNTMRQRDQETGVGLGEFKKKIFSPSLQDKETKKLGWGLEFVAKN